MKEEKRKKKRFSFTSAGLVGGLFKNEICSLFFWRVFKCSPGVLCFVFSPPCVVFAVSFSLGSRAGNAMFD